MISDCSNAVVLFWFSFFGVRVSVTFHLVFVHIILARFRLLSGTFCGGGGEMLTRFALYFGYL